MHPDREIVNPGASVADAPPALMDPRWCSRSPYINVRRAAMIGWQIVRMSPLRKIRGRAFSNFICNFTYSFSMLDVYSDGLVNCWGLVDLPQLRRKAETDWISPQPLVGEPVRFHHLGAALVAEAEWKLTALDLVDLAIATIAELNTQGDDMDELACTPLRQFTSRSYYREGAGGVILGIEVPLLIRDGGSFLFTPCPIYANGTAQLWPDGPAEPVDAIIAGIERGSLAVAAPEGAWISISGLGQFRSGQSQWYVTPAERIREIHDEIDRLNGAPGLDRVCIEQYKTYRDDPSPANKERLRIAAELVPRYRWRYFSVDMQRALQ
jgi:hypothetical protein